MKKLSTPTKILLTALIAAAALFALWKLTSHVEGPKDTRTIQEQDDALHETMGNPPDPKDDPEGWAQFKSQVDMLEGTEGGSN